MFLQFLPILSLISVISGSGSDCNSYYQTDVQSENHWEGVIVIIAPEHLDGWVLKVQLYSAAISVESPMATVTGSGSLWTLTSSEVVEVGTWMEIEVVVHFSDTLPYINSLIFNDEMICFGGYAPTTSPTTSTVTTSSTTTSVSFEVGFIICNLWQLLSITHLFLGMSQFGYY